MPMTPIMYLKCFLIALVGAALQAAIYLKNTQDKSKLANVEFNPKSYLKEDWLSVTISMLTILLALLLTGETINFKPEIMDYIQYGYAFIGYFSSDIASRLFGAMNKKVNSIIDQKTTEADRMAGTLDKPTPTKKP